MSFFAYKILKFLWSILSTQNIYSAGLQFLSSVVICITIILLFFCNILQYCCISIAYRNNTTNNMIEQHYDWNLIITFVLKSVLWQGSYEETANVVLSFLFLFHKCDKITAWLESANVAFIWEIIRNLFLKEHSFIASNYHCQWLWKLMGLL